MKFNLRKKTGVNGTEIFISVLFDPEDIIGITTVRDDEPVTLDNLRIDGDDYQRADHSLMLLRSLVHYADLAQASKHNPAIKAHLLHGKMRMKEVAQRRKRKRR